MVAAVAAVREQTPQQNHAKSLRGDALPLSPSIRSNKGRRRGSSAPLTLVGSPPLIHLLQWKSNTMNPPLKFAGRRTGDAAGRPELEPEQASVWAAVGSLRTRGRFFLFPGIPAAKQREEVTSSNSCCSKMELAAAEPIRARLRRLPLLCGLEPGATARSHRHKTSSLQAVFTISTVIHCHDGFISTPKARKAPLERQLQDPMLHALVPVMSCGRGRSTSFR